jgi:hypothetical protein
LSGCSRILATTTSIVISLLVPAGKARTFLWHATDSLALNEMSLFDAAQAWRILERWSNLKA